MEPSFNPTFPNIGNGRLVQKMKFYNGGNLGDGPWMPAWRVAEVRFFTDENCHNLIDLQSLSFTPTGSSHYQCGDSSKVFDGIVPTSDGGCETWWGPGEWLHSNARSSWFGIEFAEAIQIGCVQIAQFNTQYCQTNIFVEYEDPLDSTWKEFTTLSGLQCEAGQWEGQDTVVLPRMST